MQKTLVKSSYLAQKKAFEKCLLSTANWAKKETPASNQNKSTNGDLSSESPFTEYVAVIWSRVYVSYLPVQVKKHLYLRALSDTVRLFSAILSVFRRSVTKALSGTNLM